MFYQSIFASGRAETTSDGVVFSHIGKEDVEIVLDI
jgi:hypothetical protein